MQIPGYHSGPEFMCLHTKPGKLPFNPPVFYLPLRTVLKFPSNSDYVTLLLLLFFILITSYSGSVNTGTKYLSCALITQTFFFLKLKVSFSFAFSLS